MKEVKTPSMELLKRCGCGIYRQAAVVDMVVAIMFGLDDLMGLFQPNYNFLIRILIYITIF